jgi:hypothetical protein
MVATMLSLRMHQSSMVAATWSNVGGKQKDKRIPSLCFDQAGMLTAPKGL